MQIYIKKEFCLMKKKQKQTSVSEIYIQNYLSLGTEANAGTDVPDAGRARAQV